METQAVVWDPRANPKVAHEHMSIQVSAHEHTWVHSISKFVLGSMGGVTECAGFAVGVIRM